MATISLRDYQDKLHDLLRQEQNEQVISHCRHILQYFPRNADTYRFLAEALLGTKRWSDAGEVFRRVLSVYPDDFTAHTGLYETCINADQPELAIWHLERAFEQEPNNAEILKVLRRLYREHRGISPKKIQLTAGAVARQFGQNGLYNQAIDTLIKAIQQNPRRVDLTLLLAQTLWLAGRPIDAAETALRVLRELPDCLEANRIMAELWLREERPSDAQQYIARMEQVAPYFTLSLVQGREAPGEAFTLDELDYRRLAEHELASARPDWLGEIDEGLLEDDEILGVVGFDSTGADDAASAVGDANDLFASELPEDWMSEIGDMQAIAEEETITMDPTRVREIIDGMGNPAGTDDLPPADPADEEDPLAWMNDPGSGLTGMLVNDTDDLPPADPTDEEDPLAWMNDPGSGLTGMLAGESESPPADETTDADDPLAWMSNPNANVLEDTPEDTPPERTPTSELIGDDDDDPFAWMNDSNIELSDDPLDSDDDPFQTGDLGAIQGESSNPMAWLDADFIDPDQPNDDDPFAWMNETNIEDDEDVLGELKTTPLENPPTSGEPDTELDTSSLDWLEDDRALDDMLDMEALTQDEAPGWLNDAPEPPDTPTSEAELDWMIEEASEPEAASTDEEEAFDWLDNVAPDEELAADTGELDWKNIEDDSFDVEADADAIAAGDMPDWLVEASGYQDSGNEVAPGVTADQPETDENAFDWAATLGDEQDEEEQDNAFGFADSQPDAAQDDTFDWMTSLGDDDDTFALDDPQPTAEQDDAFGFADSQPDAPQDDAFDWMASLGDDDDTFALDDPQPTAEQDDAFGFADSQPDAPQDDAFDWMASLGDDDDEDDAFADSQPTADPAEPDWLASLGDDDDEDDAFADSQPTADPAEPDWLASLGDDDDELDDTFADSQPTADPAEPDWLASLGDDDDEDDASALAAAASQPDVEQDDAFDWMASLGDDNDDEDDAFVLDDLQPETELDDQPNWLASLDGDDDEDDAFALVDPQPTAESVEPDWLASLGDDDDELDDAFADSQPTADPAEPDWLASLGEDDDEQDDAFALAAASQPDVEQDDAFDWMASLGDDNDDEDDAFVLDDLQPETELDDQPNWLASLDGDDEEIEDAFDIADLQPEAQQDDALAISGAQPEEPDWLASPGDEDDAFGIVATQDVENTATDQEPVVFSDAPLETESEVEDDIYTEDGTLGETQYDEIDTKIMTTESNDTPSSESIPDWLTIEEDEFIEDLDDVGGLQYDTEEFAGRLIEEEPDAASIDDVAPTEDGGSAQEETNIQPVANAPDWLNAMVPGLDLDFEAVEEDPIEKEFIEASQHRARAAAEDPQPALTREFDWLMQIVEQEGKLTVAPARRRRRFIFTQSPLWLQKRGSSESTFEDIEDGELGEDLPPWLSDAMENEDLS